MSRSDVGKELFDTNGGTYNLTVALGVGAYGLVCSATDKRTGEAVAIKKLRHAFDNSLFAQRTYREIRILRQMDHQNVIRLRGLYKGQCAGEAEPFIYLVADLVLTDLQRFVRDHKLDEGQISKITAGVLSGLNYLHSAHIIHRDLKPSNIGVNSDCSVKILDFGLARFEGGELPYTGYVQARWYRAPDVILCWEGHYRGKYDEKVDLWSLGCILAELLLHRPLLQGRDYMQQIVCIGEMLGRPDQEFIDTIHNQDAKAHFNSMMPGPPRMPLEEILHGQHSGFVDLLKRLIVIDPRRRLSALQAMQHRAVKHYFNPELVRNMNLPKDDFLWEDKILTKTVDELRRDVDEEIKTFNSGMHL